MFVCCVCLIIGLMRVGVVRNVGMGVWNVRLRGTVCSVPRDILCLIRLMLLFVYNVRQTVRDATQSSTNNKKQP